MFNFFKRKSAPTETTNAEPGEPLIAALLMQGERYPMADLQKQLAGSRIGGHKPREMKLHESILMFELDDELVAIAPMPAPYPWSDLEGPCTTSWMWPKEQPAVSLKSHKSHVLVTMMKGEADPIRRRLLLTQLTSLAASLPGVQGIYWPEGTLVHYPKVFSAMAKSITDPQAPPLYLWVDFRVYQNEDGTCRMFTTGMAPLGQMEIEIPSIEMQPGELREWAVNLAYYFLEKGRAVKNGDTIGVSAEHQMKIRHKPSEYGSRGTVIRIEG
jgi:hypothetical protein